MAYGYSGILSTWTESILYNLPSLWVCISTSLSLQKRFKPHIIEFQYNAELYKVLFEQQQKQKLKKIMEDWLGALYDKHCQKKCSCLHRA